ncbi:MAG: dihydroorotase [Patescibacteria group bacterium]
MAELILTTDLVELLTGYDLHVHFRSGKMGKLVAHHTARSFHGALVMPNLDPPITTATMARGYREQILTWTGTHDFTPIMTIKITGATTPEMIQDAKSLGFYVGKLYPEGVTHNSLDGVKITDIEKLFPAFAEMEKLDMVLCLHGEMPRPVHILKREEEFLAILRKIARKFPNLRIVLEHITTEAAVKAVLELPQNVVATITLHHLYLTLEDVIAYLDTHGNEGINPHHYCKPIAKFESDRQALRRAAFSGFPKFFFGSDTAPHSRNKKECSCGCAGVFTAPVALPMLWQFFLEMAENDLVKAKEHFDKFVRVNGANHYKLPLATKRIRLSRKTWMVPDSYGDTDHHENGIIAVPFMAGKQLQWFEEDMTIAA